LNCFPIVHIQTLIEDYIGREAAKAFAYGVEDPDIKIKLLLGGEKTVNKALRQALEVQAVLVAARHHKNNSKTYRGAHHPHSVKRREAIRMLEL
jgi:hypothetical protein